MTLVDAVALVMGLVLTVYVLLGGADFGGGVWDLLARGPRAEAQRHAVSHAIGPIWEANHVWMIVAVVLLFTAYPTGFAVVMIALHVPISLMLVGIVLRGTSFVFRKVDAATEGGPSGWQTVFAVSSLLTPVMIGVVLGTVTVPGIGYRDGVVTGGYFAPWLHPLPWAVGFFTLAVFAWLAAAYLVLEVDDPPLRDDFRVRSLGAGWAVAVTGSLVLVLGVLQAPSVVSHFAATWAGRALLLCGAIGFAAAQWATARRRFSRARAAVVVTTVSILLGWGVGQYPWIVRDAVAIHDVAAPDVTLRLVLWVLGLGSLILVPAFAYLYLTFKGRVLFPRTGG